jgi:hypothetical protein
MSCAPSQTFNEGTQLTTGSRKCGASGSDEVA